MATESEPIGPGKTLLSWEFPEYEQHDRSPGWYFAAVIIIVGLLLWALLTANFLFAVIILFAAFLLFRQHRTRPERLSFAVTDRGIDIHGRHFYSYDDLKNFWIVTEPEVKRLYFEFNLVFRPRLTIPLEKTDPKVVRKTLLRFLMEDTEREDEPTTDALARVLKL
ncbi:MAG: hypothetical protein HY340_01060 [Candidatus Kerfeldbacteria bacterium]|nr:hypothetical protein [Candidatus Kerfeldbacteria bacterium]